MRNRNKSARMSLPQRSTIHGIEVRKVPIGQYLAVMDTLKELPGRLLEDLFPGVAAGKALSQFADANSDVLLEMGTRLLGTCPRYLIDVFCELMELDAQELMNTLTPKELVDVWKEFWKINDMSDFFATARNLIKKMFAPTTSNESSPSPSV